MLTESLTVGGNANNKLFKAIEVGKNDKAMDLFTTIVDPTIYKVQKLVTELVKRALPLRSRSAQSNDIFDGFDSIYRILDSLNEGIMILDADSTVTYLNPASSKILGIQRERILWKKFSDLEPQSKALAAITTKQPIIGGCDLIRTVGKEVLFDANCIIRAGEVVGLTITFHDISALFKLDKIIRQYEKSDYGSEQTKDKLPLPFKSIIGSDPGFVNTLWFASQVSSTEAPVLLEGESGVGKEIFARAIHNTSSRKDKPMITINCASIPEVLFESELFGYDEGAFTGAKKSGKPGKFELANGGTLFFDEIGELPISMQSKLLRVLQLAIL